MAGRSERQRTKRKVAASETEDSDAESVKKIRKCRRSGCPTAAPICFVRATSTCCGNGYTSRWYHISAGEHFCNECFEYFYRSSKKGYDIYTTWKRIWCQYGKADNGMSSFMSDQMLPYWLQCNQCDKWRQVYRETEITPEYIKKHVCSIVLKNETQEHACSVPEDVRVEWAHDVYNWPYNLTVPVFIKSAMYAPYVRNYFPDMVGISPSDTSIHKYTEGITEVRRYLHPFQDSKDQSLAMSVPPHAMMDEELLDFPDFSRNLLKVYLIIRNTIIALWNLNIKRWVTKERCMYHLNLRGLSRVWMYEHVDRVLMFLTVKGYINHGVAQIPKEIFFMPTLEDQKKLPVIIVGAGLAGLAAARQLSNLGVQVTVLEASSQLGGRAIDAGNIETSGTTADDQIGLECHMINGCYNNPVVVMCKQCDIKLVELSDQCVLLNEGEIVEEKVDKRIQFHFEAMLDINKQHRPEQEEDVNLLDKFQSLHEQFKDESGIRFSQLEEQLIQFNMSNLEYSCGSNLGDVSSQHWDVNDDYPQFHGPAVLVQDGFSSIVNKLTDGIHIVKDSQVTKINYGEDVVMVTCKSGEEYQGSKVILTVPVSVMLTNKIEYTPALPDYKTCTLGSGHVEKIMLEFPCKFWSTCTKEGQTFGRVTSPPLPRGMCDVFYDLSLPKEGRYILVSYVSGQVVDLVREKTNEQLIDTCVNILKQMFPKEDVPQPIKYAISRWYSREHINMSYCYVPTNAGNQAFDNMERDVDGKLFFAGEGTHKQFYQTVTGAYMSGIREAEKVYRELTKS